MTMFVSRRAIGWTCVMIPCTVYYWNDLVVSLEGSKWQAALIVLMAWICGCTDINHLTGQPEGDDHHHHHD